ncbi:MAG: LLM class flavin-dependent oxidoreductase [Kibdelosporangium sp.]
MTQPPGRFGCFLSPLHPPTEDPVLTLRRDIGLIELADELNYDEFWVGEHHSAGWGSIASPEIVLAAAAERTRRITLATGVVTLPYHHPFMVAERALQLDNLTRGRFILGVGAGSVPSDMHMLNIPVADTRRRTEESLEVVADLLRGGVVTRSTGWFELTDARTQLRPFNATGIPLAVASALSPFGMRLAGRMGAMPLSYVAPPWGALRAGHPLMVERLAEQWEHFAGAAAAAGRPANRDDWRLLLPVHVAETTQQALDDIYPGWLRQREQLWATTMGMPVVTSEIGARKAFESTVQAGGIVVGSVEDCVAQVQKLTELSGGFGGLLLSIMDWAPHDRITAGLELFARQVIPRLRGAMAGLVASNSWAAAHRDEFQRATADARDKANTSGANTSGADTSGADISGTDTAGSRPA